MVHLRFGVVLAQGGGFLDALEPVFRKGLGGRIASGKAWLSWIHLDDLTAMVLRAVRDPSWSGVFNAVSPEPVRNADFTEAFVRALRVRKGPPVPALALRLLYGEMADVTLQSQRVLPARAQARGFGYAHPTLEGALQDLYAWKTHPGDRLFEQRQWVPERLKKVFGFFSDERNLEAITPEWLHFEVEGKSTPALEEGTEIDYRLRIHGVPARWRSRISLWEPDRRFRDVQLKGPYARWEHTHGFAEMGEGTLLKDRVIYRLPASSLGGVLFHPLIRKDIGRIFGHRRKVIAERFKGGRHV